MYSEFDGLANFYFIKSKSNRFRSIHVNRGVYVCVWESVRACVCLWDCFFSTAVNGKKKANGAQNIRNLHAHHPYTRTQFECHRWAAAAAIAV